MRRSLPAEPEEAEAVFQEAHPACPKGRARAPDALECPHQPVACPALGRLLGATSIPSADARTWAARLRPCGSCRIAAEANRARLRGLRLGQREREVLTGAGRHEVFIVTEPGMGRAASASRRRAAQTLARAGLVAPACAHKGAETAAGLAPRAAVSLTPMGRYVLAAFGRYIEAGKPVRWTRPRAGTPLPGHDPSMLVDEALDLTRQELHKTLGDLKRVLIVAVGRPVRDPVLLDQVTLHLQRKAQGLRDLLAPKSDSGKA